MQSTRNRVVVACAGSGKTTMLVSEALSRPDKSIVILTYTQSNRDAIVQKFGELNSGIPRHVEVFTWFTFLLRECARPYQHAVYNEHRIESLAFVPGQSAQYVSKSNTKRYYFCNGIDIYSDKISNFVLDCEDRSNGRVISRLARCYNEILIDEFQDMAGWDLEVVAKLLGSDIKMTLVCDPRQTVYQTNHGRKNKQYRDIGIVDLIRKWEKQKLCAVEYRTDCHRSNQAICDFGDSLWKDATGLPPTKSKGVIATHHDGVFLVQKREIEQYIRRFKPCLLRYNKTTTCAGYELVNFGVAKGLQFDRVLIIPHGPIQKFLKSGKVEQLKGSREKFYVAITRAKYSVGIVYDDHCALPCSRWVSM